MTLGDSNTDSRLASLQLGSADPVSGGPYGDSGEWIVVSSFKVTENIISTTSSTFNREEGNPQSAYIPKSKLTSATNVADVGLSFGAYLKGDTTGETVTARIGYSFTDLPNTEVSASHSGEFKTSDIESISSFSDSRTNMYMKTTAGTGRIEANLVQYLWIKLK